MTPRTTGAGGDAGREEEILAAARAVFGEKGFDGATVSEIVRRAGVAQGTFYLYYPSKKEAFFALGLRVFDLMARHVDEALDGSLAFEERIRAITKACFDAAEENADIVGLVFFGADSLSVELQRAFVKDNPVVAGLRRMFEADIARGEMEPMDPEIAARLIMGLVKNAVLEAFVLGEAEEARRLHEGAATLFVNAVRRR